MKYIEIKMELEELLDVYELEKVEFLLNQMIENDLKNALKYKKAFFSLIKDINLEKAIQYGEDISSVEEDPKFLRVLAIRYKRIKNFKKYKSLINRKIPLLELKQQLEIYMKNHEDWKIIENYVYNFKKQYQNLEKDINKVVFSKLKDYYTKEVLDYGENVLEYEQNPSFIKVLANRYKKIGNVDRYEMLMKIIN